MDNCLITKKVKTAEEVSDLCKNAESCKSKMDSDGNFSVSLFSSSKKCSQDPRKIFVKKTTQESKVKDLSKLLKERKFIDSVKSLCKNRGKDKETCKISIKVNVAPASQKQYHYYTDPIIADYVIDQLKNSGFNGARLVESETNAVLADPRINPTNFGKKLGFHNKIYDLTKEKKRVKAKFKNGEIYAAISMVESDVIIDMPKPKNHDLMKFTGSLKNMYGSIPDFNKYILFHHKKSGLNVQEATMAINHTTPVDIIIADWVDSVDGNEVSYFDDEIEDFKHFQSNRIIYSTDPLITDKYIARKMGYSDDDSEILEEEEKFVGKKQFDAKFIDGDDDKPIEGWRKIGTGLNIKAKMQDYIPVNDKMVAWGIRNYAFPLIMEKHKKLL